ncbi:oligosaccharide repeat unit polymerase [Riemerella anatipestifer]|uniref:O-antigen polymerase n=1 Tax=Riemerella anatipestifer TaxID=34085 RepID=UPI001374E985|nr:O-antigen polymerase [Riemerella anatipestifer]
MGRQIKKIYFVSIIQCVLLIVLYALLYVYKNDPLLVGAFIYSLFLGFFLMKKKMKDLYLNDTALIFLLFLVLYGCFNSIIQLVMLGRIDLDVYKSTIIYALTVPSYLLGWSIRSPKTPTYVLHSEQLLRSSKRRGYNNLLTILLTILILYKSYFFYSVNMFFNISGLQKSRYELFDNVSQADVVIGLLISGIFLYFIYFHQQLSIRNRGIVIFLLLYYVLLQLGAGNRRDFMPMLLGMGWLFVNYKKIKFNFVWLVLSLLGITFFNYLGTIRASLLSDDVKSDAMVSTMTSNEFVYPFFTLNEEVSQYIRNDNYDFKYGETIITYPIIMFIPRAIYEDKPRSLAAQFVVDKYGRRGQMGYAYTPVSEFFINFGVLGPFFCYFIIGYFIARIQKKRNQILNFVFFTMILDFCRGEMGTFFYQFVFIALFIYVLPGLKKYVFYLKN